MAAPPPPPAPAAAPAPAPAAPTGSLGPSLTDQYVSQLATPFSGTQTRTLLAGDEDTIPVGSGVHVEAISLLFTIFLLVIFVTVMLGIIYEKYFKTKRNPYKNLSPDERDDLGEDFTYTNFQYVSVAASIAAIVALLIIFAYVGRWVGVYNPTLLKQNAIAQDIAVAMRGKQAVDNVSNLLATSVHPVDDDRSKTARKTLSDTLKDGIRNGFQAEMNAERSKLGLSSRNFRSGNQAYSWYNPSGWGNPFRQQEI